MRHILLAFIALGGIYAQDYPAVSPPCLLGTYTVRTLPTNPKIGCLATVTDGTAGSMCTRGDGGVSGMCRFGGSGVGWSSVNGPDPTSYVGSNVVAGLSWPVATVTPTGTTGATSYTYVVVGTDATGNTRAVTGATTTGNASLSALSYNLVTVAAWSATSPYVAPVGSCSVYRTVGGATTGVIGTISSCAAGGSLRDTGLAGNSASVPADTSGNSAVAGTLYVGTGGAATKLVCYKADGKTLGYATMAAGDISACN